MSDFFFYKIRKHLPHLHANMLSSVGDKLVSLGVHTVSPWAEYVSITEHLGISGEAESCRGSLSYGDVRLAWSRIRQRAGALEWGCG